MMDEEIIDKPKPKFNPNKEYTAITAQSEPEKSMPIQEKPKFDASKPYEPVKKKTIPPQANLLHRTIQAVLESLLERVQQVRLIYHLVNYRLSKYQYLRKIPLRNLSKNNSTTRLKLLKKNKN